MSLIPLPRAEGRQPGLRGRGREPYVAWEEEGRKGREWLGAGREGRREGGARGALLKFKGIPGVTVSSTCNDISSSDTATTYWDTSPKP